MTTFEELYQRYQTDFDEFVAVDSQADMISDFGHQVTNPLRQQIANDPRVRGRKAKLSDLESNYADFLIAVAPGPAPALGGEIASGHMDRVAKPGAFIYIVLEPITDKQMPNLRQDLAHQGYTVRQRNGRMSDPSNNFLGIPVHSRWDASTWWEIYKVK